MSRRILFGAVPNRTDEGTLTPGSEVAELPAANLQDRQLGKVWRTTGTTEAETYVELDMGQAQTVGIVAMGPHNLEPTSQYRVRVADSSLIAVEAIVPDGVVFTTVYYSAGTAAEIDEPFDSPDGLWMTAVAGKPTEARMSFSSPSADLQQGAGLQQFRARVRYTGSVEPPASTATIALLEGGVELAISDPIGLNALGTTVISFNWDASLLSDISGAAVECRVNGLNAGAESVEIGTVEWSAAIENPDFEYDSGWLDVWPQIEEFGALPWGVFTWGGVIPLEIAASLDLWIIHPLPTPVIGEFVRIDIRDSGNADGFVEFGRLMTGPVLEPSKNMSWGWSIRFEDLSRVSKARGGQVFVDEEQRFRVLEFEIGHLQKQEMFDQFFHWLDRVQGTVSEVFIVPFPDDPTQYHNLAFRARQKEIGAITQPFFDRYTKTFSFEELL